MATHYLKIHSIESFGAHDGPGIRMVVFLQGCNLKCLYCQNADTITQKGGEEVAIEEIVRRAKNMRTYFKNGGGVTVSGGEPCLQSAVVIELFKLLHAEGIHTNVDTNATVKTADAQKLITEYADLVMFDIKHTSASGFKELTHVSGLDAAIEMISLRNKIQKPFWLRYVMVPTYNNQTENINWIIEQFSGMEYLERLELIPFHQLGGHKWKLLGEEYKLVNLRTNTEEELAEAELLLKPHFKSVVRK
ncbi:MAG: pyruvate formate-lyase-activating protein [Mangrovibacterium sp.]